jgi:hypothetical protein
MEAGPFVRPAGKSRHHFSDGKTRGLCGWLFLARLQAMSLTSTNESQLLAEEVG